MADHVTIKLQVQTDRLGSKVEKEVKVDAEEWSCLSSQERRDYMLEELFNQGMVEWDYEEIHRG